MGKFLERNIPHKGTKGKTIAELDLAPVREDVANKGKMQYNSSEGVISNEFRRLQKESRRMSDEELQRYRNGSKKISNELYRRLSIVFSRKLGTIVSSNSNSVRLLKLSDGKGNNFEVYKNIDGQTFHDVFEISRQYLQNGELVDLHKVKEYEDTKNYLSKNGLSGFSVTKNGNLISIFNVNRKKGFLRSISNIVKKIVR